MSADWKAGDRALCVEKFTGLYTGSFEAYSGDRPQVGTVYLVTDVGPIVHGSVSLLLSTLEGFWRATKFRKIVPECDRIAQNQEKDNTR